MKYPFSILFIFQLFWIGCNSEQDIDSGSRPCGESVLLDQYGERNFRMGFSSWSYGGTLDNRMETYSFIGDHSDVYSEQIDNKLPWNELMAGEELPDIFVEDLDFRLSQKISSSDLILSVSLLNSDRNDLIEGFSAEEISLSNVDESLLHEACMRLYSYLIERFSPHYLVMAMEVNELKLNAPHLWNKFERLMNGLRAELKVEYEDLLISESVTLHNLYPYEGRYSDDYINYFADYINQNHDFAAISFYPFIRGLSAPGDIQPYFDFLHHLIEIPVSFVETAQLAEDLELRSNDFIIPGSECIQKEYLEVLLYNAYLRNYEFVIWWAHRDYDFLWDTFPPEVKEQAKIWRDTGLLDENGIRRAGFDLWSEALNSDL